MSSHLLEVVELLSRSWSFSTRADRPRITWWPNSLPGSDGSEPPPRRRPARRKFRRGRIQLVAA